MKVGQAYETLKNESKCRAYDLIHFSIKPINASSEYTRTPTPSHTSTPQNSEALNAAAQMAALQNAKREREVLWQTTKNSSESFIVKLQVDIRILEWDIKSLDKFAIAVAAEEASQEEGLRPPPLFLFHQRAEESQEYKERRDRAKQERKIERDIKERELEIKMGDFKNRKDWLKKAQEDVNAANMADYRRIAVVEHGIWFREHKGRQERLERERVERKWAEIFWKQAQE